MPTVQVILGGVPRTTVHDTYDFPIVLQFGSQTSYESAVWVIPSIPRPHSRPPPLRDPRAARPRQHHCRWSRWLSLRPAHDGLGAQVATHAAKTARYFRCTRRARAWRA